MNGENRKETGDERRETRRMNIESQSDLLAVHPLLWSVFNYFI